MTGKGKGRFMTTNMMVPTRSQNLLVGSVANLVILKEIAVLVRGNHCKNTNGTSGSGEGSKDHNPNEDDDVAWWIDSDATTHACKDRGWFKVFQPVDDSSVLHMENESSAPIVGVGSIVLEFTSGKTISLSNVLYVPKLCKNLVSSPVLNKCGFRQVFESDKYILSKSGVFADFGYYNNAINDEMDSIMGNNTWVLADLPPGCKLSGCKWIFKKKMKGDGTIKKFKAILVIQGFRQRPGIDYFDTYVPIAHRSTIRLLIALASIHNLVIHQMDVKTTFLNGDLDEEVYMKQPEGFIMPGNEHKQVDLTKEFLSSRFSMKDIGEANGILGIRIIRENKGIYISQSHYIEKLEYSKVIGCLMYAMTSTRPDIAYAMGKLSRFTSNPSTHHWEAIRRVLQYLKKTMDYGLSYSGFPSILEGYSDASWITNVEDHSSTSGWVFLLGGGAISWASKKQTCITNSTMEFEFVVLAAAGKEAEWLKNLIHEIPLWPKPISPISIHCDSAATLAKAYSQMYNVKSRHLGVRHSMIIELIMNDVISVKFVRSQHNLADHLTKGLARDLVHKSVIGMGLKSI
ncbi:UNVERIFIED_CONTAM: Retrovirus-related Pol polyprotein from transposon TNT 1-94 [Sesamum radiatum]|uniref:Retrovirus-related Pol polyprotein from transposon TNT 1-94 n=1 Tax=Sesamum radiatum TaxID=300843 RepID=A0AAW2JX12_SESRA